MEKQEREEMLKKAKANKKNIVVEIYQGCFSEIHNIPERYTYEIIDWDNLPEEK